MLPDVLVVVHAEATPDSLGPNYDWRAMLGWARGQPRSVDPARV